jgi:outer membrane protein OmpA-like peptidoglycan-associated protein
MKTLTALIGATLFAAAPAMADTGKTQTLGDVYFKFDSANVSTTATLHLATLASWAKNHPQSKIVLDGNADSVGHTAYNVRLALRRAESVQAKLIAAGVDPDRIIVVTYGEDNVRHSVAGLDRRVTIWATQEPLRGIVSSSLVRGTAIVWTRPVDETAISGPRPINVATR